MSPEIRPHDGNVAELVEILTRPGVTTGAAVVDYDGRHLVAVEIDPTSGGYAQRIRLRFARRTNSGQEATR